MEINDMMLLRVNLALIPVGCLNPWVSLPFQDAGSRIKFPLPEGYVLVYHTHGLRQYIGTCKLHLSIDCRHLVHWRPEKHGSESLGKVVMREAVHPKNISERARCKTCWR